MKIQTQFNDQNMLNLINQLQTEQTSLTNEIKNFKTDDDDMKQYNRELPIINNLLLQVMKLRKLKKN